MSSILKRDENHLLIFHELKKRRTFVGELCYVKAKDHYELIYDDHYRYLRQAIPLGPELSLIKARHISEKGKLFESFLDRLPMKANAAYPDYCRSQGISPDEKNLIILLGTIGRRGPSTFVFESVYKHEFSIDSVKKLREKLGITRHDFAEGFDIRELTLQRIESGKSQDPGTLKRLELYFEFPETALWQLRQTGCRIHHKALAVLRNYFSQALKEKK